MSANASVVSTPKYTQSAAKSQVKICARCRVLKFPFQFSRYRQGKDGLQAYCKDCMAELLVAWRKENRQKARAMSNRARKVHRQHHPDRAHAQGILTHAIQSGSLIPQPCRWPRCGSIENIEGHHPSYNRPLRIVWLCHGHHKAADACNGKLGFKLRVDIIPKPIEKQR